MKLIHKKFLFGLLFGITFEIDSANTDLVNKLNAPEGFEISIYADGLESPRQMTETNDGSIIVVNRSSNLGLIIGGAVGGFVLIVLILYFVYFRKNWIIY